jgi:hypothetical protein
VKPLDTNTIMTFSTVAMLFATPVAVIVNTIITGWIARKVAKQAEKAAQLLDVHQKLAAAKAAEVATQAEEAAKLLSARQDEAAKRAAEVAAQAEEAAKLLAARQDSTARKTAEVAVSLDLSRKEVAEAAKKQDAKLDQIHSTAT